MAPMRNVDKGSRLSQLDGLAPLGAGALGVEHLRHRNGVVERRPQLVRTGASRDGADEVPNFLVVAEQL
jgi:hypothetical protein